MNNLAKYRKEGISFFKNYTVNDFSLFMNEFDTYGGLNENEYKEVTHIYDEKINNVKKEQTNDFIKTLGLSSLGGLNTVVRYKNELYPSFFNGVSDAVLDGFKTEVYSTYNDGSELDRGLGGRKQKNYGEGVENFYTRVYLKLNGVYKYLGTEHGKNNSNVRLFLEKES